MTGDEARAKLRATLDGGGVIIGAGAGPGLSAKCAEAGRMEDYHVQPQLFSID